MAACRYGWQEEPVFKAVLLQRKEELRETGLAAPGQREEWLALITALDDRLRNECVGAALGTAEHRSLQKCFACRLRVPCATAGAKHAPAPRWAAPAHAVPPRGADTRLVLPL